MNELREFQKAVHELARSKGFYETPPSFLERVALMHSELSEAVETARKEFARPDEHCPEFANVEIELADCIIRILDCAEYMELDVIGAMQAKHEFNKSRPHKHGKNI